MFITGIGSRETPTHICEEMIKIGEYVRESDKFFIRSGHAEGADWAFEKGAQERCIVYLPWLGFNQQLVSDSIKIVPAITEKSKEITRKYHPAFQKLSSGALKLHCRNTYQILGDELRNTTRTSAVVCWTSNGKNSGGTGQALRIADAYGIPVINMFHEEWNTAEKVISYLESF